MNEFNQKYGYLTNRQLNDKRRHFRRKYKITLKQWRRVCEFYGNRCLRCNKPGDYLTLTPDHVLASSLGGKDDLANYQPLCFLCNSTKQDRHIDYRQDHDKNGFVYSGIEHEFVQLPLLGFELSSPKVRDKAFVISRLYELVVSGILNSVDESCIAEGIEGIYRYLELIQTFEPDYFRWLLTKATIEYPDLF